MGLLQKAADELLTAKSKRRRQLTTDPLGLDKEQTHQQGLMSRYTDDLVAAANILRHGLEQGAFSENVHLEALRDEKEWNDKNVDSFHEWEIVRKAAGQVTCVGGAMGWRYDESRVSVSAPQLTLPSPPPTHPPTSGPIWSSAGRTTRASRRSPRAIRRGGGGGAC